MSPLLRWSSKAADSYKLQTFGHKTRMLGMQAALVCQIAQIFALIPSEEWPEASKRKSKTLMDTPLPLRGLEMSPSPLSSPSAIMRARKSNRRAPTAVGSHQKQVPCSRHGKIDQLPDPVLQSQ